MWSSKEVGAGRLQVYLLSKFAGRVRFEEKAIHFARNWENHMRDRSRVQRWYEREIMNSTKYESVPNEIDAVAQAKVEQWAQWAQYVVPAAGDGPVEVNPSEIRQAASQDPYPQWIYGALLTPENSSSVRDMKEGSLRLPSVEVALSPDELSSVQGLPEDEIRELLVDHVGHQCCWGRRPATKWNIKKVEDCNAFIGALESFIEEREVYFEVEPYSGQPYTSQEDGRQQHPWEVDMRDEFPLLFTLKKEARKQIPFSARVEICQNCSGSKGMVCPECHANREPGKSSPCGVCHGRGLVAQQDGSDLTCVQCEGTGKLACSKCNLGGGIIQCSACLGNGSLLHSQVLIARWRTLINKKVSASSYAATVPDDVLHEASGMELYGNQSHLCQPVQFPSSYGLTKLSSDLFATREAVPPTARLIVERHQLRLIPITRVVMCDGDRLFKFYIIGLDRKIYLRDYPSTCWLCCCMPMFSQ